MAGHSKWSKVKRIKAVWDVRKSKTFTKFQKEITIAAKLGGGDPSGNARLRMAIERARAMSIPRDNIERAVKKGTGELEGGAIEELIYEGYGPTGIAFIVGCATDNRVRTVAEIRNIFAKKGGVMGESGSVAWMFDKKGMIQIDKADFLEDQMLDTVLECEGDDLIVEEDIYLVVTEPQKMAHVMQNFIDKKFKILEATFEMVPKNQIEVPDPEVLKAIEALYNALEDHDDVQNVWANFS